MCNVISCFWKKKQKKDNIDYLDFILGFDENNPPCYESGSVVEHCEETPLEKTVIKCGAVTGLTIGFPEMDSAVLRLENAELHLPDHDPSTRIVFYQQHVVRSTKDIEFFEMGDSGSFVFVREKGELSCFGMAIGKLTDGGCIVTPIHEIMKSLQLPLSSFVCFCTNTGNRDGSSSEEGGAFGGDSDDIIVDEFDGKAVALGYTDHSDVEMKSVETYYQAGPSTRSRSSRCEKSEMSLSKTKTGSLTFPKLEVEEVKTFCKGWST